MVKNDGDHSERVMCGDGNDNDDGNSDGGWMACWWGAIMVMMVMGYLF